MRYVINIYQKEQGSKNGTLGHPIRQTNIIRLMAVKKCMLLSDAQKNSRPKKNIRIQVYTLQLAKQHGAVHLVEDYSNVKECTIGIPSNLTNS